MTGNPQNVFGDVELPLDLPPLPPPVDHQAAALAGVRSLLVLMGEDPDRPGLVRTPERVVNAFMELTNQPGNPAMLLGTVFEDVDYDADQMIAVGPIEFTSLCEHHLLPFTGKAWVAYIPTDSMVVGLSKIPRVVEHFARRPQVQERMTSQIASALEVHLAPQGVGVVVRAHHSCMGLRGVRKPDAYMTTSALRGAFRDQGPTRNEFLATTRVAR